MTIPARAQYFGPPARPLFGWLHAADDARGHADIGLVLCNPFGYESICTHRTYRHLAERAAQAGIPALRFDYDGTGDSAGDDYDADRVKAWIASIDLAIDELKARTGVTRVCLAGFRIGALLASLAAIERDDVAGLLAIAPVVKGRAFLRELRALALARPQPALPPWARVNEDIEESAGFVLSSATRNDLQNLDLTALANAPAPEVLLLDRDDLPLNEAWPKKLEALGAHVEKRKFSGYALMTTSAHDNVIPESLLTDALAWLEARRVALAANANSTRAAADGTTGVAVSTGAAARKATASAVAPAAPANTTAAVGAASNEPRLSFTEFTVRESIVRPDLEGRLIGILTEPLTEDGSPRTPTNVVLLLNSGAISRIGPGRVYVTLARHLAQQGDAVLRLDISGIGDSGPHPGDSENAVYTARAQADIQAALRFLETKYGNASLHAVGICSGAFHSFKAAVGGMPLQTAVLINPLTFFWTEGMAIVEPDFMVASASAYYMNSARQLSSWLRVLRGQVNIVKLVSVVARRLTKIGRDASREVARHLGIKLKDDLAMELRQAVQGPGKLYFIFGSHDPGLQLLREQGGSTLNRLQRRGSIRVDTVAGADHTFTAHWARDRLISLLTAHLHAHPRDGAAR